MSCLLAVRHDVFKPLSILSCAQLIVGSDKHSYWNLSFSYQGKINFWRIVLTILAVVNIRPEIILLELFAVENLDVMVHTSQAATCRNVPLVDSESIGIILTCIVRRDKEKPVFTQRWEQTTVKPLLKEIFSIKYLPHAGKVGRIPDS